MSWSEEATPLIGELATHSEGLLLGALAGWAGGEGEDADETG